MHTYSVSYTSRRGNRAGNIKKRRVIRTRRPLPLDRELKFIDQTQTVALTAPTNAAGGEVDPNDDCLNGITQGDNSISRDGSKIVMRSIQIKGFISCAAQANQTATDLGTKVFIALVQDKQTNGVQLNSEDVFTNPSGAAIGAPLCLRTVFTSNRYNVLKTFECDISNPSISYDGTNIEQSGLITSFSMYKKLNMYAQYSSNNGDVSDIVDNSLHLIAYCSSIALVPTLTYNSRVRFIG